MPPKVPIICDICEEGTLIPINKTVGYIQFDAECPVCKSIMYVGLNGKYFYYDDKATKLIGIAGYGRMKP